MTGRSASEITKARRRPRGAVRDGLIAAGLELARAGGPDAVVLREATQMVGVVPNAAYRHFAGRDELLAAVATAAMRELAARTAAGVARVRGKYGDPAAARRRLRAIGRAYLEFARDEPGLVPPRSPCRGSTPTTPRTAGPGRTARRWVSCAPRSTRWPTPACSTGGAATASSTPSGPWCTGWPYSPCKGPCASPRRHPPLP